MKHGLDIFAYDDYRTFLRDWLDAKREEGVGSARWFAKRAGFGAHDILLLVATGKRNLSMRSIAKFVKGLTLKGKEATYFENLVLFNQAQTPGERLTYYERLIGHPSRRKATPLEQERLAFFRSWLAPVIFEMTQFEDFRPDAHWIAEQFASQPSVVEVKHVLETLTELGFVREEGGRWFAKAELFDTGDAVTDVHLYSYHEHALEQAADALSLPTAERYYQVTTVAAPKTALPEIEKLAKKFETELLEVIEQHPDAKDEVYQMSFQAFPVLRRRSNHNPRRGRR